MLRKTFLLLISVTSMLAATAQPALPPLTDSIDSKILGETRGIQVIFPKEYKNGEKLEIVYILDGEWYYDLVPFAFNFAQSAKYIPQNIFVLIRNRYKDGVNIRNRDFSPTKIPEDPMSGGADNFYNFLTKEVVPYIEKKYPANGQRTLVGSSYSGLFSVYAFMKDPTFFNSFVASDPNLNFDNNLISRITRGKMDSLPENAGTLFIGCITTTSRGMGSYQFDSVMKVHAPKKLLWKVVQYPDESHYSVQLKAFYDAARFSHGGFGVIPSYHPAAGLIDRATPFSIVFTEAAPGARVTTNGSVPDSTSQPIVEGESAAISVPGTVRVKSFGNRPVYTKETASVYEKGRITPGKVNKKVPDGLRYAVYGLDSAALPSTSPVKAEKNGTVDSAFAIRNFVGDKPKLIIVEGLLDIPSDGEYIFYTPINEAMQFELAGRQLMKGNGRYGGESYVVTLVKGKYPVKLSIAKKSGDVPALFMVFQAKPGVAKWWEGAPWKVM
jgi:predicted alpha/beta superfamily hydrolase